MHAYIYEYLYTYISVLRVWRRPERGVMREVAREGPDPHVSLASNLLHKLTNLSGN